uniref:DNA-directed DNA polymerase n=1 Tax=Cydia pomonella granulosis virus TaxID=28289 RepID=A0A5B8GQ00_GVCP|nr:dnapol [Cydia pomonella granulovirus]QGY99402.1 DNA polymerase [Cydia pomonella granulovirus]QGY99969.1 DNA polymerase [Cydia pomonella granulovirus]
MLLSKRKAEGVEYEPAVKAIKLSQETLMGDNTNFKVCLDVNELIPAKLVSAGMCFNNTHEFLITRLRYDNGFLLLFLTGVNNVQLYYKTPCTIHSYRRCYHMRTPCVNKCETYKSMVVTGLKAYQCNRINVFKVDRARCNNDDAMLLDRFCTDVNRVQMQLGLCEGDYVRFKNVVRVNEEGLAIGPLGNVEKLKVEDVRNPTKVIVASFDLETFTNLNSFSNPKVDPIITISLVVKTHDDTPKQYCFINTQGRNFTLDDPVEERVDGEIIVLPYHNERDMIVAFFTLLCKSNPDTILDYNGDKFDIPYWTQRAIILDIDPKFLRRYNLSPVEMNTVEVNTKFGYKLNNHFMKYFNHLDVYQFIKGSIDASKLENLKLDTAASYYLKVGKVELPVREMMRLYNNKQFGKIVKYNVRDSLLPLNMFLKCKMDNKQYADASLLYLTNDDSHLTIYHRLNLALFHRAISNINEAGRPDPYFFNRSDLSKIMGGNKRFAADEKEDKEAENEGELVDFTVLGRPPVPTSQIPADAIPLCDLKTRIKYIGGKVLSPKPGYYRKTFTLDFSQLYTSIMIFFTTCLSNLFVGANKKLYLQINQNAITTKFLKEMANNRVLYKQEMKKYEPDSFEYQMYDSWQNAAKLVCNSQYGWFGLCCKPLANFITAQGRSKLEEAQRIITELSENEAIKTKWNLSKMKLEVVYGDTDSNFVSIDLEREEFERMGGDVGLRRLIMEDIMKPLNDTWKGAFKMELENIMDCMLIKGKKSYMCLKENGTLYKRGFNVKKDSPLFLRQAFDAVIFEILNNHSLDCILNHLVSSLKKKRDEFCVANCEEYSFSQTLNETKNGGTGVVTIANELAIQLRNDANTKYIPSSGDRIPYLLIDKLASTVKGRAKPTQLINADDTINWSKHLGIVNTFLNDIMSMIGNDTLFVYAFNEICEYFQKDQCFDVLYPNIKTLTNSRIKDILCKELNVKKKKDLTDDKLNDILRNNEQKFIHKYEFTLNKRRPAYTINIERFSTDCPKCNERGVSAVQKTTSLELVVEKQSASRKRPSKQN